LASESAKKGGARYRVLLYQGFAKDLARLPRKDQRRIAEAIDGLALDPRPPGVKKLGGGGGAYRIRVGDYRIIYQVRDNVLVVVIVRLAHRKDVYQQR